MNLTTRYKEHYKNYRNVSLRESIHEISLIIKNANTFDDVIFPNPEPEQKIKLEVIDL